MSLVQTLLKVAGGEPPPGTPQIQGIDPYRPLLGSSMGPSRVTTNLVEGS